MYKHKPIASTSLPMQRTTTIVLKSLRDSRMTVAMVRRSFSRSCSRMTATAMSAGQRRTPSSATSSAASSRRSQGRRKRRSNPPPCLRTLLLKNSQHLSIARVHTLWRELTRSTYGGWVVGRGRPLAPQLDLSRQCV